MEDGMHSYTPRGVCSRRIDVELDGDVIKVAGS